ncbi:glycogen debranching protein GlgX [Thaumasiovibrio sp. DFM-14]|uniref:glycogen debranching protein GlgX n=1 Tax=Thaumasiovibrio sp. DFM-14 TaxID=3384792 RepID=UPI0039A36BE6
MEWQIKPGKTDKLGATLTPKGCNFAIHAVNAKHLHLVLFNREGEETYFPLLHHRRHTYALQIDNVVAGSRYAYCQFHLGEKRWLIDPYADALTAHPLHPNIDINLVVDHNFDWQGASAPANENQSTVLCETHVKGFTQCHPDVPEELRGTYLGLCHPAVIDHFKRTGITTIQLLPITTKKDEQHLIDKGLTNYWGYNPVCFFAPDKRFAVNDPVVELKTMVRELHRHDIEVILDVVYNHTAEGGDGGELLHYKALDPQFYYQTSPGQYANFTGCGNTVDLTHPPALRSVLDSLRHWVETYHIDGFRFDLAATLGRRKDKFDIYSGFFQAVYQDPALQKTKLIAEPWDIGPDGYQLGHFPRGWNECNDKFRDTMRSFWHGEGVGLADFATRLMGSRDLFSASRWPDKLSVNYITYHDGFTLQDLVSYNQRHNEANGEKGKDGHGDNRSCHHGIEGPTDNLSITAVREKQKRNFMLSLLFSFGIPHVLAVDALSHSQGGNNNAYCQDTPVSWVNWALNERQQRFHKWLAAMIRARNTYMKPFIENFSGNTREMHRIRWMNSNGSPMTGGDWHKQHAIALHLGLYNNGRELLYLINPTKIPTRFRLPNGNEWQQICDTSETQIQSKTCNNSYMQVPQSLTILYRKTGYNEQ